MTQLGRLLAVSAKKTGMHLEMFFTKSDNVTVL